MKKIIYSAIIFLAVLPFKGTAQNSTAPWPELKAFHTFMAATFHPTEEGNFKPLRQKADSLLLAAKAWQASVIPTDYKPELTKKTLKKLVKQCEEINDAVKANAADIKLKALITEAHEIFHTIVEKCRTPEK